MKNFINLYFFISLSVLCFSLNGQTIFDAEKIIMDDELSIDFPIDVLTADLDGDGDMDLVTATWRDSSIIWYENLDGLGSFSQQRFVHRQMYFEPRSIAVADIDGDGDIDVVSSGQWFENIDEKWNFTCGGYFGVAATTLTTGDIDGDGDIDIVGGVYFGHKVVWLENEDGAGTFGSEKIIIEDHLQPTDIVLGDIDGDGDLDVAVGANDIVDLIWFDNDGLGNFSDFKPIDDNLNYTYGEIELADLDNDGDNDIVYTTQVGGGLTWHENLDGFGNFDEEMVLDSIQARGISVVDLDMDNDLDLVVASSYPTKLVWYENNGAGVFGEGKDISVGLDRPMGIALADLDGDSDLDVVATGSSDDDIAWFENLDGFGENFAEEQTLYDQTNDPIALITGDMDGDGDQDLICASEKDSKFSWFENEDGLGNYTNQTVIGTDLGWANGVHVADFDGDGDLDVVGIYYSTDKLLWYENLDGLGNFGEGELISNVVGNPTDVFAADMDGDGDQDAIVLTLHATLAWYENTDGLGNFDSALNLINQDNFIHGRGVYVTDLDNDGDNDVLAAYALGNKLAWYENDGTGSFSDEQIITTQAQGAWDVYPGDIDGDGDLDVVSASIWDDEIAWYENLNGMGNFGEKQIVGVEMEKAQSVVAFDADQDGDVDIVAGSFGNDKFVWYENIDGAGTFGPEIILSDQAYEARALAVGDADNDGDLDIFAGSAEDDKVVWFENFLNMPAISGICFYDENQNKIKDENEIGLLSHNIKVTPEAIANYTNRDGEFRFFVEDGDYTIEAEPGDDWMLTTDFTSYTVNIEDTIYQDILFGLFPTQEITVIDPSLISAPTRCGFDVPFWYTYQNTGTTYTDGRVSCELDPKTTLLTASPMPDSIHDNVLFWNFEQLPPSYFNTIRMTLNMPGVEFLGDTVTFINNTYAKDEQGIFHESDSSIYQSVINCAYDPNDKMALPAGVGEDNLTLFGEEIEYTVRFQNTGTDTAFNVRIEDQLDANLDWNTFRPLVASHDYEVNRFGVGIVEFVFANILLPDSTTNEPASHGFLKYKIKPLQNLPEQTSIENTADIYFDFNPAIRTNTTLNTYVSMISTSNSDLASQIELDLFPNPAQDFIQFTFSNLPSNINFNLKIWDTNGKVIKEISNNHRATLNVNCSDWQTGMYFFEFSYNNELLKSGKVMKF